MNPSGSNYNHLATDDDTELRHLNSDFSRSNDDGFGYSSALPGSHRDSPPIFASEQTGRQSVTGSSKGDPLQVYWLRTLTCIFLPALIAFYYAIIWVFWIRSYDQMFPVAHGRVGGRWIYYSWFFISAVAINVSKYGLAGAEAAMLMDRRWKADNAMQLTMHCDKTWSGPTGWINLAIKYAGGYRQRPSSAWLLLSFISLLPLVALPLSGFTLQLSSGYEPGQLKTDAASLNGRNKTTFGNQLGDVFSRAANRWRYPSTFQLAGRSAYYVPKSSFGHVNNTWLQTFPNNWPDDDSTTIFLAPQSDRPVTGEAWGLQSSVNCTAVSAIDDFKLLSQRSADGSQPRCPAINFTSSGGLPDYDGLPHLCDFDVYLQFPPASADDLRDFWSIENDLFDFNNYGFLELALNYVEKDNTFNDVAPLLMEAALWQSPIEVELGYPCPQAEAQVSNNLGTIVRGMQKTYSGPLNLAPLQLDAVGVQCNASFIAGTATLDGLEGTYESFVPDEPLQTSSATLVPLATAMPRILRSEVAESLELADVNSVIGLESQINKTDPTDYENPLSEIAANASWLLNIYKSVDAYNIVPLLCNNTQNSTLNSAWGELQLINSDQFKHAVLRVYKAYAIELSAGQGDQWYGNLSYARPTLVITSGPVSPIPVMVLLILWGILSCILGVTYGVRPRWAEILDGFSMFRFGSDFPGFADGICAKTYDQCPQLLTLPGLVGDGRPNEQVGHISLVEEVVAVKHKKYQGMSSNAERPARYGQKFKQK